MAVQSKVARKHEKVEVLNDKGEAERTLMYPEGGSLYEEAKRARESGTPLQVYKTNGTDSEEYTTASNANVSTSIDPIKGTVSLNGPSWLISEVAASDSFKKNYTENKALLQLVNLYRADPSSTVVNDKTQEPIKVSDMIKSYQDAATAYANAFTDIKSEKINANKKYGVNYTDEDVYIANNFYDKNDYPSNGVVYIPNWAMDKYDWSGLSSWDSEHRSVSAEDFFRHVFLEDFDNHTASTLQDKSLEWIENFANYNAYDRNDEIESERENVIADKDYANEVARTEQMLRMVSQNKPEVAAAYNVIMFTSGAFRGFAEAVADAGVNISSGIMQAIEGVCRIVPTEIDDFVASPVYWSLGLIGESINTLRAGVDDPKKNVGDYFAQWGEDFEAALDHNPDTSLGGEINERKKELKKNFAEISAQLQSITGAWAAGEYIGNVAWKIAENVVMLDPLGRGLGAAISSLSLSKGVALSLGKIASAKTVGNIFNALGKGGNIFAQSILETFIDDRDLLDKALASGSIFDGELWGKLTENLIWNTVGEQMGDVAGLIVKKTNMGKMVSLMLDRPVKWIAGKGNLGKVALSMWLHRWTPEQIENAMRAIAEGNVKGLGPEMMNTALTRLIAQYQLLGAKIKVFGKTGEEIAQAIEDAYAVIQPRAAEATARAAKLAEEVAGEGGEGAEEAAEAAAKSADEASNGGATAKEGKFKQIDHIKENYELSTKIRTARVHFENQIDSITKSISMKQSEMDEAAAKERDEFLEAGNKVTRLEGDAISKGRKLTHFEEGSILTKESSQYLSWKSQLFQYKWRLSKIDGLDKNSVEYAKMLNQFYDGSAKNLAKSREFVEAIEKKLADLEEVLGDDLKGALDELLPKAGAYNKAITDYMISHGYLTNDEVKSILKARAQGWGDGGINYIPTRRLFEEDATRGFSTPKGKKNKDKANELFFNRKTASDGLYKLKEGNIEDDFADPIMELWSRTRKMAAVGAAQDMARAVQSAAIVSRGVLKFSDTGVTKYDLSMLEKGMKGITNEFNKAFEDSNGAFAQALKNRFLETDAFSAAFEQKAFFNRFTSVKGKLEKAQKTLNKAEMPMAGNQRKLLTNMSDEELDSILNAVPDDMTVPRVDISGMRAAEFNEWFNSLPKDSQKYIEKSLKAQNYTKNVTNVKKLVKEGTPIQATIKRDFIGENREALAKTGAYQTIMKEKYAASDLIDSANLRKAQTAYEKALVEYNKIAAQGENVPIFKASDIKTLGDDFRKQVKDVSGKVIEDMRKVMRGTTAFDSLAKQLHENYGSVFKEIDDAEEYIILTRLSKMKAARLASPLTDARKGAKSLAEKVATKAVKEDLGSQLARRLANSFGEGLKEDLTKRLDEWVGALKLMNGGDAIDLGDYWKTIKEEVAKVEKSGFSVIAGEGGRPASVRYDMSKLIQMVDPEGNVKFYEVDPLTAMAANGIPNFEKSVFGNRPMNWLQSMSARMNQIFRWGTTGMDIPSYVNQWFRDPMDATIVGFARPFTDLNAGSLKNVGSAFVWDSVPGARATKLGQRLFGDKVVTNITDGVVETTFESTKEGLIREFGGEWWDNFAKNATKNLTGEEAEAALKRATVEFSASSIGASALPNMGGMTEAQFYRASTGTVVTPREVRGEQFSAMYAEQQAKIYGEGMSAAEKGTFRQSMRKMSDAFDSFLEKTSRGDFRESFARRNVFTSQYNAAIKSGMTSYDARIWATRYALDATTDFGRTFMFANNFIKSVPYLGAAINGNKSLLRLLTIDPSGVASRFINGMVIPYMMVTVESLSDPKNREVYKTIREYEKEDSVFIVYKGEKVQIPIPQQLARFLAPVRHAIEKCADVQDISWLHLLASDALGLSPVDLSGFANLDANELLSESEDTGIWNNIYRGVEKAASSLMPPATKSIYMLMSGRDPYTGRKIDTSYIEYDENGDPQIMDSTKSDIAKWLHSMFPGLSASAALKITQTIFGRSTISVLDGMLGVLTGSSDPVNSFAEQLSHSVDGGSDYDQAKSEWNTARNMFYEKRRALENDEEFSKALSILRNSNSSEQKKAGALVVYNEKMDEYARFVLDVAKAMKQKYPDQYTRNRVAQVISALTMSTGPLYRGTEYSNALQSDAFYDARAEALHTFIEMGFPESTAGDSVLGTSYYNKETGEYDFKPFTPYQLELMQSQTYGSQDQIQAMIASALKKADINTSSKWAGYYAAPTKAARKKYEDEWNKRVVKELYPIISKYGLTSVLNSRGTREMLDDYVFVDNPFKAKEYLYKIFGGK